MAGSRVIEDAAKLADEKARVCQRIGRDTNEDRAPEGG